MEVGETPAERDLQSLLGFAVATLDDRLANRYGIDRHLSGAVVVSIDGDSQAYQQGLREGDLIRAVNRARVNNKEQFLQAVSRLEEGSSVLLRLYRNGNGYYLAFVL
jgi:serine protease Do